MELLEDDPEALEGLDGADRPWTSVQEDGGVVLICSRIIRRGGRV
jgi:hypothetical protein